MNTAATASVVAPPLKYALLYAEKGWFPFPCWPIREGRWACRDPKCDSPGKHPLGPLVPNGLKDATNDPDTIKRWFAGEYADANVALSLGPAGLLAVDVDGPPGEAALQTLVAKNHELPETTEAKSGRPEGGRHIVFTAGANHGLRNRKIGTKLETRGDGGYIVVAPSIHQSGARYQWSVRSAPAPIPAWLRAVATKRQPADPARALERLPAASQASTRYGAAALHDECAAVRRAEDGDRNNTLFQAACRAGELVAGGELDENDARNALADAAITAGLGHAETAKTIDSGIKTGATEPRSAPTADSPRRSDMTAPRAERHRTETRPATNETPVDTTNALAVETWAEFSARAGEEVEWLVDGLIPVGGIALLGAAAKAGKTWLGLASAISVAAGVPFLGHPVKRGPVLYVAMEGQRAGLRARVGAMARGMGLDPDHDLAHLHFVYKPRGLNLLDATWATALAKAAKAIGAVLVILDVLRATARVRETGEGVDDLRRLVEHLAPLTDHDVTILALHHFKKWSQGSADMPIEERLSGSGDLWGIADAGLFITTPARANPMNVVPAGREGPSVQPFSVALQGEATGRHGGYSYLDALRLEVGDAVTGVTKGTARQIAEFVRASERGDRTPKEICEHFTITDRTLANRRPDLAELDIEYIPAGKLSHYRPTPNTPKTAISGSVNPVHPEPETPYRGSGYAFAVDADAEQ